MGATDRGDDPPAAAVVVEDAAHLDRLRERHDLLVAGFYGDWCGPRVALGGFLDGVAEETPAAAARIDVEANAGLADDYTVRRLPTVVLFRDGDAVERLPEVRDEGTIRRLVERHTD